ncbi:hypothetical protein BS50DRAFT_632242 [Corynespora cassiicola Philippines]|uniref:Xylanolytic transcriptional activator regulatory domain-containing protein n=1 Tax=Corynespora cassiicola Philippines TaxID=1448308 RepID=A0A2T2NY44_CORCC|nr:hypothetical protein BS50DRAFT_632242 [Corynespora cassiicola Philippines]
MPESGQSPRRRRRHDETDQTPDNGPTRTKRRAFLQTMGQQLREFGTDGTSPRDQSRSTFGIGSSGNDVNASAVPRDVAASQIETPESDAAPGEEDQLPTGLSKSASRWLWRPSEVASSSAPDGYSSTTFQDLLDWSQSYFDHWHPAFPFLHAPSLLEYFKQIEQRGRLIVDSPSAFQHIILRSVMSISLVDRRQITSTCRSVPATFVFHSFNDALNSVQRVLTEESSIISLQAVVSVQLFLISMLRYNAASRLEGLAVRIAFQLGLHRCPTKMTGISVKEMELRKRLFWSIFCIDRYICIRLGIPLGIQSKDIDVCFPHEERHVTSEQITTERDDRLNLVDNLARHADIRGSIMESRIHSTTDRNFDEAEATLRMDAEHTRWWNHVDEYLSSCSQASSVAKLHQVTLIVLRFESVIALHRSTLATSKKSSAYDAALQRCISASRSIINTLHKALQGFGAFDGSPGQSGYESTPLLWPSFTWAVWMSAFIVIFAATEKQLPQDVAFRLGDKSIEILKHLALRGTAWPEACTVAIQNLLRRLKDGSRGTTRSSTAEPMQRRNQIAADRFPSGSSQRPVSMSQRMAGQPGLNSFMNGPSSSATNPNGLLPASEPIAPFPSHASVPVPGTSTNLDAFMFSNPTTHASDFPSLASTHLAGAGTFLGIAQQLSDNPIPNDEIMNIFNGEDINSWMGEDWI